MFYNRIVKVIKNNPTKFTTMSLFGFAVTIDGPDKLVMDDINFNDTSKLNGHNINELTYEICHKLVDENPENIAKIPTKFITDKMCNNVIELNPNNIVHIPFPFVTDELCDKLMNMNIDFYFLIPKERRTYIMHQRVYNYYMGELKKSWHSYDKIPKELVNDIVIFEIVAQSEGKVDYAKIKKYKIEAHTQRSLNKYCQNNYRHNGYSSSDNYCNTILANFKPKIQKFNE